MSADSDTIEGYELKQELGRGGMAVVYLAVQKSLGRKVALKVLQRDAPAEAVARFLSEAHLLAGLTHPNIVVVHDIQAPAATNFIAMEFLPGGSLAERMEQGLSRAEAIRIVVLLADALAHAHQAGVVHRDLKPENVMFRSSGTPVLTDFGIALQVSDKLRLTQEGTVVGTPTYLSPEQIDGEHIDTRADLYSLGVMWFELMTGHPPFSGKDTRELLMAHLTKPPPPLPAELAPLQRVLERLLAKRPAERYQDADHFLAALRQVLVENPQLAEQLVDQPELSHVEQLQHLGFTSGAHSGQHATQRVRGAHRPRRSWRTWRVWTAALAAMVLAGIALWWWLPVQFATTAGNDLPNAAPTADRRSIAVLPFRNLDEGEQRSSFAEGLHDELITQLAKIREIKVIARSSVDGFRGGERNLKDIAATLGVATLLEGSVRRAGKRVRLNMQLIEPSSGALLWVETFDRELTDVFEIQNTIAQAITRELSAQLSGAEQASIAERPTRSPEAFDLYVRAREWVRRGMDVDEKNAAKQSLERALVLDPEFARAHALLSYLHSLWGWFAADPRRDFQRARSAALEALRLAPAAAESNLAMGYVHYYGERDYSKALAAFERARSASPNDAQTLNAIGQILRRQNRFDEAIEALRRAAEVDPLNENAMTILAETLRYAGRYPELVRAIRSAEARFPHRLDAQAGIAMLRLEIGGDIEPLRRRLDELSGRFSKELPDSWQLLTLHRAERNYPAALAVIDAMIARRRAAAPDDNPSNLIAFRGFNLAAQGEAAAARKEFERALAGFEAQSRAKPDHPFILGWLALTHAALGQEAEARASITRAADLATRSGDEIMRRENRLLSVLVDGWLGDYTAARAKLTEAIEWSVYLALSNFDPVRWRFDPVCRPLWNDPELRRMLEQEAERRRGLVGDALD